MIQPEEFQPEPEPWTVPTVWHSIFCWSARRRYLDLSYYITHFTSAKVLQVLHPQSCRIVIKSARMNRAWPCVCVCVWESVCLRSRAARFEMSGLDWFLLPLINSCYALMFCIENCWMAFSEIKTTNSAFHNLTGDWREADSWMIASLGDFFFFPKGELSTPSGFFFFFFYIHVASFKHCCSACRFI